MVADQAIGGRSQHREPRFVASPGFVPWLQSMGCSLAFTSYELGKLVLLGINDAGAPSLFERTLERCMGLHVDSDRLHVAAKSQVLRFRDAGPGGGWDRRYLPRMSWYTGDLDAHDLSLDREGRPLLVATAFNAVVRVSEEHSFEPVWWPRFLSAPLQGDRCHLNGLATEHGVPSVVTLAGPSTEVDGWRAHRLDGGQVIDARTHEVLADGLSLPHSPRIHQGKVWFLEAGRGRLCVLEGGDVRCVAELPGFARGLAFVGPYAVVGLSAPRSDDALKDLPLQEVAARLGRPVACGLAVVHLDSGHVAHTVTVDSALMREIFDVAVLPDTIRPMAVGFRNDELDRTFDIEPVPQRWQ